MSIIDACTVPETKIVILQVSSAYLFIFLIEKKKRVYLRVMKLLNN